MDIKNKRNFGTVGEKIAVNYLIKEGYRILEKNFRTGRLGEVDIIAKDGNYLCFVEVKTRSSTLFGMPSEAVNKKKMENIIRLANIYIINRGLQDMNIRFDIIEILVSNKSGFLEARSINLIKNAFLEE